MSIITTMDCMTCGTPIEIPFNEKIAFIMDGLSLECQECEDKAAFIEDCQAHRNNLPYFRKEIEA